MWDFNKKMDERGKNRLRGIIFALKLVKFVFFQSLFVLLQYFAHLWTRLRQANDENRAITHEIYDKVLRKLLCKPTLIESRTK